MFSFIYHVMIISVMFLLCVRIFVLLKMIFLDSTKLKIVWTKITTFFKRRVSIILWSFSNAWNASFEKCCYFCLKMISNLLFPIKTRYKLRNIVKFQIICCWICVKFNWEVNINCLFVIMKSYCNVNLK